VDLSKKIGALISINRKAKNISQEELADVSGLHPDYIGKIERGERNPSLSTLLRVLDSLSVRYSSFFKELE